MRVRVVALVTLVACGGRTGLDVPPPEMDATKNGDVGPETPRDARDAAEVDAFEDDRTDAPLDEEVDVVDAIEDTIALDAPRPIAPPSTSRATTRRPTFRWTRVSGATGARVEVCADRACIKAIARIDAMGTSTRPAIDLPPGVVFWRVQSMRDGALGTATSPVWELVVPARSAPVESANGALSDFDGDGRGDVAVVVFDAHEGHAHLVVHLGASSAPSLEAHFPDSLAPDPSFDSASYDVAAAGDVNGDGVGDLVVGADVAVHVFYGVAGAPPSLGVTFPLGLDTSAQRTVRVTPAGDVDGDGYGDIAFLAHEWPRSGRVEIHRGGPSGVDPVAAWRYGADAIDTVGAHVVTGACDANADGFSDLTMRVLDAAGTVRTDLLYGGPTGPVPSPDVIPAPNTIFRCGGDVDGDGYADFLGGIEDIGGTGSPRGSLTLFYGAPAGLLRSVALDIPPASDMSTGSDVDADGLVDMIAASGSDGILYLSAGAPISGAPFERPTGASPPGFGQHGAAIGDVDGDGFDDAAFTGGAYVFVFRGSPSGFGAFPWPAWRALDESGSGGSTVEAIATTR
jgi:hypothetical protein